MSTVLVRQNAKNGGVVRDVRGPWSSRARMAKKSKNVIRVRPIDIDKSPRRILTHRVFHALSTPRNVQHPVPRGVNHTWTLSTAFPRPRHARGSPPQRTAAESPPSPTVASARRMAMAASRCICPARVPARRAWRSRRALHLVQPRVTELVHRLGTSGLALAHHPCAHPLRISLGCSHLRCGIALGTTHGRPPAPEAARTPRGRMPAVPRTARGVAA